jgi:DNA polymerase I
MLYNPRIEEAYKLLHDGILALSHAEQQGLRVDMEYIERKMRVMTHKIDKLEQAFKQTNFFKHWQHSTRGKVNIHSGTQLGIFLYRVKKIKIEKENKSGQGSVDDEALRQMGIPELNDLLTIRKLKRVRDTYLAAFAREQVNGYLHPFFNLHLVTTYRSSSDHPNFQNIPKRDEESMQICRKALYPRPGHQLLEIDYSGLEVRIATCYHKDKTMLAYINDPKSDMHTDMTKQIFMIDKFDKSLPEHDLLRYATKNGFVFPEFYGDYYKKCASNMACNWGKLPQGKWSFGQGIKMPYGTLANHFIDKGIKSLDDFTEHIRKVEADFWGKRFFEYAEWKDKWYNAYRKQGYIDLLTGFRCSGIMSRNDCLNYPVQGAAFHCLLWSFIRLDELIRSEKLDSRLIGQIHDSILIDVSPDELEYITEMAHKITCFELPEVWKWIIVPLDIDAEVCPVDASWAEKEKYKFK